MPPTKKGRKRNTAYLDPASEWKMFTLGDDRPGEQWKRGNLEKKTQPIDTVWMKPIPMAGFFGSPKSWLFPPSEGQSWDDDDDDHDIFRARHHDHILAQVESQIVDSEKWREFLSIWHNVQDRIIWAKNGICEFWMEWLWNEAHKNDQKSWIWLRKEFCERALSLSAEGLFYAHEVLEPLERLQAVCRKQLARCDGILSHKRNWKAEKATLRKAYYQLVDECLKETYNAIYQGTGKKKKSRDLTARLFQAAFAFDFNENALRHKLRETTR